MMDNLPVKRLAHDIVQLTLSQPSRRNAVNAAMWAALPDVLADIRKTDPKVLIVTGAGDHFASGADISEFETLYSTPDSSAAISTDISSAMAALATFPVPTIARIQGACVGGGLGLALCCDLRFCDTSAKFAITPAKLGLVYPFADVVRLIDAVGTMNAKDLLFSARLVGAVEAQSMGLAHLFEDHLDDFVLERAHAIADQSGQSARVMKKMFREFTQGQRQDDEETVRWFLEGFASDDFKEGYTAFLEKRAPEF
ncbi:MAG: enoyl-CoA hydratase-related protein [Pseudomonadota bacterium]